MRNVLQTRVTDLLGITYPIIQTGMGWVAHPTLVAATCNAGGFGFLAAATLVPDQVEASILEVKERTDRPFGVNFLMDAPGAEIISESIMRQGVRAAGYNRAPNAELIDRLKSNGVLCIPTCGALRHAVKAEALGADLIIVQGSEGGGHTGTTPSSLLISAVADSVDVPVIAAGGFQDGRGLVAALAFGAEGIAMGTRFLMTQESPVPEATLDRYLRADMDDVIVSRALDGMPQRIIENELTRRLETAGPIQRLATALRSALSLRRETGATIPELIKSAVAMRRNEKLTNAQMILAANAPILARIAMNDGDPVRGYLPSGTVAGVLADRPSCEALIQRIVKEALETIKVLEQIH